MEILTVDKDLVINGKYAVATTSYRDALDSLYPLIDRLEIQRKLQVTRFYKRLESDLVEGCIMPPLTLAFVDKLGPRVSTKAFGDFVAKNISKGFVLDGIQRLSALMRASKTVGFDDSRKVYLNIIVCESKDSLLYRMITLNNGQKPMTARHQIEILTDNLYQFDKIGLKSYLEKEKKPKGNVFKKADLVSAYIAFLSASTSIENPKVIESKMDQLIADKIIERGVSKNSIEFSEVADVIAKFAKDDDAFKWLSNANNLIGFVVGADKSILRLKSTSAPSFVGSIERFEEAFSQFDVSKIKLGRERRKMVNYFIENYGGLRTSSADEILIELSELD
ncbi:conserved protein of unknown function [uncultured Woeseiaceae bacterium]|uniref:DUF262 domain-containing protein n=1 Tax=uncultured Woeseiaceae bacterium TaxID=1983305 RepID=A0A7D9D1I9_9GAMM|nr:conserved protein of unknown function [uncultured Woeseiaceae bacterium]